MSGSEDGDFMDRQAEESSDEDADSSSDESEDEEDEGGDVEGLIDDNPVEEGDGEGGDSSEEEEEQSGSEEGQDPGSRKRKKSFDQLEEDDYALIAENTGIQLQRKKFRRVHGNVLDSDEDEEEGGGQQSEGVRKPAGRMELDDSIDSAPQDEDFAHVFGGDSDEEDLPGSQGVKEGGALSKTQRLQQEEEADDEFDFIVDDHGQPIRRRREDGTYTEPMMIEAQEIFGLDFDPAEFDQLAKDGMLSGDEDQDEEYHTDQESGSDGEAAPKKVRKSRAKKKKSTIYDIYEPSELERGHFLERDAEIRVTDQPERFQVRSIPVQPPENEAELELEAEWVFDNAFMSFPISKQPLQPDKHQSAAPRRGQGVKPRPTTVPKIKEALSFMKKHSFEVPFIANYRREYIEPELDRNDLWKILRYDEKWTQLQSRKKNMKTLFESMRDYQFEKVREQPDKALTEDTRVLTDEDFMRLDEVSSNEELSDVYAHFCLYYGRDLVAIRNSQVSKMKASLDETEAGSPSDPLEKKTGKRTIKQAQKKDFYAICQENGLGSLSAKFGLTPEQFGENLRDNYQRHETEQHQIEPEVAAEDYVQATGYFSNVRSVLQGACHMVAMQISAEPLVRQALRQVFQSRALLSVKATKKGRKVIDENHNCYTIKYLRNKPVRELKGDEFLRLHLAEQDHLLEMKLSVDPDQPQEVKRTMTGQNYFEEIRQLFYRDEFSLLVEKWNAQRAKAVAHALLKVLYPIMIRELRIKLLDEAKEHVLQSCMQKFRQWLNVAPIQVERDEDAYENENKEPEGPYIKVLGCSYTHDKSTPSFFCCLDTFGEVIDFRRFNNLAKRKYTNYDRERQEKEEDMTRLKEFIDKHRPEAIVLSAETRDSLSLAEEIKECLGQLEMEEEFPPVPVELMDTNVAHIFSKSRRGKDQFPEYPEQLKMSISLARRMQEPLQEFATLASSPDDEILALRLHPLQSELSADVLKRHLEEEVVTRVNDMGVDVHYLQEHTHVQGMLQYVCGLGPRKAAAILKILKQEMVSLQNRSQLVTQCSIGPQVFINMAGFLKVNTAAYKETFSDTYIEVLDSTRVHPETYEWARKMAVDALEIEDENDGDNPSSAVEEILRNPDKLRDLDLDAFAEELERQDYGNKRTTLYDIRNELFEPFKERRAPYVPISQFAGLLEECKLQSEEMFTLLTGETMESLYEGRLFTCTVVGIVRRKPPREVLDQANPVQDEHTRLWKCPFCLRDDFRDIGMVWPHFDDGSCPGQGIGVRTRLDNGLSGFILTRNLSDKQVSSPEERVKVGQTIYGRIKSVNIEKFSVDLTCKSSDLADKDGRYSITKDIYYDHGAADKDKRKEEAVFKKPQKRLITRVITHPSFQNIGFEETQKILSTMDQGEAIFRPNSKSMENLTLTWKVEEGIYQHIDIKEQDKPNKFSLGKTLLIGNETYEDLDEILARFVQPMASFAKDLITHKCYKPADGGNVDQLKKLLVEEKSKNPKRIPYFFSASKQYPGKFCLGYQPGSKPRIEYLTVTPDGFRYRNRIHSSVDGLLKWFKSHYQEPPPRPVAPPTAHGAPPVSGSRYSQRHPGPPAGGGGVASHIPAQSYNTPTPQYGGPGQYGVVGGGGGGTWRTGGGGYGTQQTPGRTPGPAYTPSQTPHSISSMYGTPPSVGRGQRGPGGYTPYNNRHLMPGTPVRDE